MSLLSKNSKMKNSENTTYKRIFNFTLPALQTKEGFKTCPNASACAVGCYARQGAYVFSNVAKKHHANFAATLSPTFINDMLQEINKLKPDLIRIHDSGDFYNESYLQSWLTIIKITPKVKFYAYTKMISLFKKYQANNLLPINFTIIYSLGGKEDHLIDQNIDRHSKVFNNLTDLENQGYIDTSKDDTKALGINNKIGLVYHGNKKYSNTQWERIK